MSRDHSDDLWPHFVPLWTELRKITPDLLLAGGYALFLKQRWLMGDAGSRTLVVRDQWSQQTPRVTKDFDFIATLDLIASGADQKQLDAVLKAQGFEVVPQNARWQFVKAAGENRAVVLDFHAPPPAGERRDVRVEARRVKPQPSLSPAGIHARENPEAVYADRHPFSFEYEGITIAIPHTVTLALMKLVAMRDQDRISQDESKTKVERDRGTQQARKHADDVLRATAMMTREEADIVESVLNSVRTTPAFANAAESFSTYFQNPAGLGSRIALGNWQLEAFQLIQRTLAIWFQPA